MLTGWFGGSRALDDYASMTVEFLDENLNVIGEVSIGGVMIFAAKLTGCFERPHPIRPVM
jgi:hypothetical protein